MATVDWQGRAGTTLRATVVVICYLIVFAGLLFTVAGAGVP
ncbi:MAG TPA: hypothetical protein VMM83_03725 [Longimicrobiales bacterium]|nr:hypothetical protein [Longimicrobiales bacterium]